MRTFLRPVLAALLALTPTTAASANPFDGTDHIGIVCQLVLTVSPGLHYGVLSAGPYTAFDLIENNGGFLDLESRPGPATDLVLTCTLRSRDNGTYLGSVSSLPGTGVAVIPPHAIAFDSPDTGFDACLTIAWTDTRGVAHQVPWGCSAVF